MQYDRKTIKRKKKGDYGGTASEISLAAELIGGNFDLLMEILQRLPARSLIRFKCVSKHWLSLISDYQFAIKHSSRNNRPSVSGLYFYFHGGLQSVSLLGRRNLPSLSFLDVFGEQSTIRVLHSCNGLLLCDNGVLDDDNIHRHRFIVCNPTTKEHMELPPSHIPISLSTGCAYLAFDPSKSPHYKVLCFSFVFPIQCVLYCSQSACWKQVNIGYIYWGRGVFWNGAIHWFGPQNSLLRFDVNTEEMVEMPNPQTPQILALDKIMYFGESGGSLILIQSKLRSPLVFSILELDENYSGWIVKYRVDLRPLKNAFLEMKDRIFHKLDGYKVLRVAKGDNERDLELVLAIPGRIVSYDVKSKTWDVLQDLAAGELEIFGMKHYAYPFVETLFRV